MDYIYFKKLFKNVRMYIGSIQIIVLDSTNELAKKVLKH